MSLIIHNGGDAGARTRDLRLKRALLYLLSYISMDDKWNFFFIKENFPDTFIKKGVNYHPFQIGWRIIYKIKSLSNFFSLFHHFPFAIEKKKDIFMRNIPEKLSQLWRRRKRAFHSFISILLLYWFLYYSFPRPSTSLFLIKQRQRRPTIEILFPSL